MKHTSIAEVTSNERNKIQGFVENIRNKRSMAFIVVRDTTGRLQLTIEKETHPDLVPVIDALTLESVITAEGVVNDSEYVKLNGKEMLPDTIVVESAAEPLPLQKDAHIDTRMDYRWIDLRTDRNQLMFKVQTYMVKCFRDFLIDREFVEIHSPKLIAAASESGSDVFEVKYFDRNAYLCQSPQFYKQMAMASGLERIFECGPVFRAEKSFTNKHTTEFTGFDLEFSGVETFRDVMDMEERMLTDMLVKMKEKYGDAIKENFGIDVVVPSNPFPIIKLADLYGELKERYGYEAPESEKGDLTTDAERLCEKLSMDMFGHEFLFVTDYGAEKRAFYHMRDENGIPMGYDLIWRGVEITTGAKREHRYEVLKKQAEEKGLADDVKFYLDFFRYGCPPHGGFGLGVDRMTMLMLGLVIKESMFLFRGPNRLTP
ncbi:MAG: aspartate--tRNA(Asn) ligase [Oscillospiraceae bacterium]